MVKYSKEELGLLIDECKSGSEIAKNKIHLAFKSLVFSVCFKYLKNVMEAEDLSQECFIKIFSKMCDYRGEGSFEGWVRKIAVNLSITEYKRRKRYYYHSDVDDAYSVEDNSYEKIESDLSLPEINSVINKLPNGYKKVFELYFIEDYSHKEISEMLGIDVNTSKSQLCRARKMLMKKIAIENFI